MRRPTGVTLLALISLAGAFWTLVAVLVFLLAPHLLSSVAVWLFDKSGTPFMEKEYELSHRIFFFFFGLLIGGLQVIYAWGFWRLKNWARVLCIFFSILDLSMATGDTLRPLPHLLSQTLAPIFWPHSYFVMSGLLNTLLNYIAATTVLVYLLRGPVKQAFHANPGEWKWITAVAVLALIFFGHSLYKSGPELEAIRWHARHGDQVLVNGVSFPVYWWHAPTIDHKNPGFDIDDFRLGPLRPHPNLRDTYMSLKVLGYREEQENLTVDQLIDRKIQEFEKSGETKFEKFDLRVAKQTLRCVSENEFGVSHSPVYCYGDGPIYSIYFIGGESSSTLFQSIMSAAK